MSNMTIEIKPGPELDRAVAEAIGLQVEEYYLPSFCAVFLPDGKTADEFGAKGVAASLDSGERPVHWAPSTDLDAAFSAAEVVGLFGDGGACFSDKARHDNSGWMFCWGNESDGTGDCVVESTPALAICAAILKLKGEP